MTGRINGVFLIRYERRMSDRITVRIGGAAAAAAFFFEGIAGAVYLISNIQLFPYTSSHERNEDVHVF